MNDLIDCQGDELALQPMELTAASASDHPGAGAGTTCSLTPPLLSEPCYFGGPSGLGGQLARSTVYIADVIRQPSGVFTR